MTRVPVGRTAVAIVLGASVAMTATACTSSGSAKRSTSPSVSSGGSGSAGPSGSASAGADSAKQAIAKIKASTDQLPPIASTTGTIASTAGGGSSSVVAQILQIKNTPQATQVAWRLKSANGRTVPTYSSQLSFQPRFDTRLFGLVDPATKKVYHPYTYVPGSSVNGVDISCVCSDLPTQVDAKGSVLYAVLPPLPAGLGSVKVTIPGFATIPSVKVSN